MSLGFLLLMGA